MQCAWITSLPNFFRGGPIRQQSKANDFQGAQCHQVPRADATATPTGQIKISQRQRHSAVMADTNFVFWGQKSDHCECVLSNEKHEGCYRDDGGELLYKENGLRKRVKMFLKFTSKMNFMRIKFLLEVYQQK